MNPYLVALFAGIWLLGIALFATRIAKSWPGWLWAQCLGVTAGGMVVSSVFILAGIAG